MSNETNEMMSGSSMPKKPNTILGVVGALVGALLGAVLWVVIYQLGYIAAIAGIAIIYLACKGYAILSGSKAYKGIIISFIIALIVLAGTHFFCWGLEIYQAYITDYDITLMDAILAVPSIAFLEENIISFVKEALMGVVLLIVGVVPFVKNARRESMGDTQAE